MEVKYEFNHLAIGEKEIYRIDMLNLNYWNHVTTILDRHPSIEVSVLGFLQKGNFGYINLLYHFQTEDSEIESQLNSLEEKYYQYIPVRIPVESQHDLLVRENPYLAHR